jgi:hypothetical protein
MSRGRGATRTQQAAGVKGVNSSLKESLNVFLSCGE